MSGRVLHLNDFVLLQRSKQNVQKENRKNLLLRHTKTCEQMHTRSVLSTLFLYLRNVKAKTFVLDICKNVSSIFLGTESFYLYGDRHSALKLKCGRGDIVVRS